MMFYRIFKYTLGGTMFRKTKFIAIITVIVMLLSASTVHAQYDADHLTGIVTTSAEKPLPVLQAQMAVLVDASSGTILYDKSSDVKVYPASTTKMMTLIVALESGVSLTDTVTISAEAASIGGNVSENAGGPMAFEYGTTLDNLLWWRMVTPTGEIITVERENHPRHKILPEEIAVFDVISLFA